MTGSEDTLNRWKEWINWLDMCPNSQLLVPMTVEVLIEVLDWAIRAMELDRTEWLATHEIKAGYVVEKNSA